MSTEDDQNQCEECESGAPAWMATFADLMSLLMCFFVLLLSFSEMDAQKYKQVAGSMKFAFGVQKKIEVKDIPKGTSIIAKEFSPGRPEVSLMRVINQHTINDALKNLVRGSLIKHKDDNTNEQQSQEVTQDSAKDQDQDKNKDKDKDKDKNKDIAQELVKNMSKEVAELAAKMISELEEDIKSGSLDLVIEANAIRVRIRESDSFPSGSAKLQNQFYPVLDKLTNLLKNSKSRIIVGGHTDNVPIKTRTYPSNWVLSSARAANVVHHLAEVNKLDPERMEIRAYADTRPILKNDSAENRAQNRRVEVIVSFEDALKKKESEDAEKEKVSNSENGEAGEKKTEVPNFIR